MCGPQRGVIPGEEGSLLKARTSPGKYKCVWTHTPRLEALSKVLNLTKQKRPHITQEALGEPAPQKWLSWFVAWKKIAGCQMMSSRPATLTRLNNILRPIRTCLIDLLAEVSLCVYLFD